VWTFRAHGSCPTPKTCDIQNDGSVPCDILNGGTCDSGEEKVTVKAAALSSTTRRRRSGNWYLRHGDQLASTCIDGDLAAGCDVTKHGGGSCAEHYCSSDEQKQPWLRLDLGEARAITKVVIYNRFAEHGWDDDDNMKQDLVGKHVIETSADGASWATCFTGTLPSADGPFTEPCVATNRYVRLRVTHSDSVSLQLREVDVYSTSTTCGCKAGYWQRFMGVDAGAEGFLSFNDQGNKNDLSDKVTTFQTKSGIKVTLRAGRTRATTRTDSFAPRTVWAPPRSQT
jgi:hypothetical protein